MKKFVVALVVLAILVTPFTVFGATGVTYTSGFKLQNLSAATANVVIDFYNQDGTVAASVPDTIAANSANTYFPLGAVPAGFDGSAVVSSDQQVAAVTNVVGNNFQRNDAYLAFTAGATSANVPLVFKGNGGYDSWFNVQNTGASDATVNVTYTSATQTCNEGPVTIKAGAAHRFDQATNTCLTAPFVGAAAVTSSQPIAAVVVEVGPQNLLAYPGLSTTTNNPVFPLIQANNSHYWTGIQIMNTGGASTNVTVSFTPATAGTACDQTLPIPAGKSTTFGFPMPAACGATFIGSAKVTANGPTAQPLAAIVNQIMMNPVGFQVFGANGSSYAGFDAAAATSHVSMPIIMDRNSGWFTGFAVVNMGTQATNIACNFTGTQHTVSLNNVAPGAALNDLQLNAIASGYVGAATCTATGGDAKIAGVVNELSFGPAGNDLLSSYPAFNY